MLCVLCARAWCAAGGSGHVVGQSMWARLHPAPLTCQRAQCNPRATHSPRCVSCPRASSPRAVPPSWPGAWSVDCPHLCGPGAPSARLYCLPSRCDCPHALSFSTSGRPSCACNSGVRAALWGGRRSCGRGGGMICQPRSAPRPQSPFRKRTEAYRGVGAGHLGTLPPSSGQVGSSLRTGSHPRPSTPPTGQGPAFAPFDG